MSPLLRRSSGRRQPLRARGRRKAREAVHREELRFAFEPRALTRDNFLQVLVDGDETFTAMLRAIESARSYVHLETYILRDDTIGRVFRSVLVEQAQKGVIVRLMYDGFGSFSLDDDYTIALREAGVQLLEYRPLGWKTWGKWTRRDHRKILVVDGSIAFTGGLNIGEEYAPEDVGGGGWRDTHCAVTGPLVADLDALFFDVWHREGGVAYEQPAALTPEVQVGSTPQHAAAVASSHRGKRTAIRRRYLWAIRQAREYVYIANAYFVPDKGIVRALIRAARRGVDVRVLTCEHSDVLPVQYASFAHFAKLMRNGVHIYLWPEKMMHAKTALVDGTWSTVGSYNLDYVSLFQNLEVIVECVGTHFGSEMRAMFDADFAHARRIDPEEWKNRPRSQKAFEWICYKLRRYL